MLTILARKLDAAENENEILKNVLSVMINWYMYGIPPGGFADATQKVTIENHIQKMVSEVQSQYLKDS